MIVATLPLRPITSPLLEGVTHGFFPREGGASSGLYASLNCGIGSGDQAEIVTLNRNKVAASLGVEPNALLGVHQCHSAKVIPVTDPGAPREEADALVTAVPGLAISILTADCQPVLFADKQSGVIGAAHAGWRGAIDGILEATIDAMVEIGAQRSEIVAVIGPSISQRAYEVGEDFLETFLAADPENSRFFINGVQPGKYQFDLIGFGLARLRKTGIAEATWTGDCTYSAPDKFFSFRRSVHQSEPDYGRLISAIKL